jgi:hypothetical protein
MARGRRLPRCQVTRVGTCQIVLATSQDAIYLINRVEHAFDDVVAWVWPIVLATSQAAMQLIGQGFHMRVDDVASHMQCSPPHGL